MKVKFTQEKSVSTVVLLGTVLFGAMASDGAMALLPATAQTSMVKGATSICFGALAAGIEGTDTLSNAVKAASIGIAVKQGYNVIRQELGSKVATATNPTTAQKFVNAAFGMGSPNYRPALRSAIAPSVWDAAIRNQSVPTQPVLNVNLSQVMS